MANSRPKLRGGLAAETYNLNNLIVDHGHPSALIFSGPLTGWIFSQTQISHSNHFWTVCEKTFFLLWPQINLFYFLSNIDIRYYNQLHSRKKPKTIQNAYKFIFRYIYYASYTNLLSSWFLTVCRLPTVTVVDTNIQKSYRYSRTVVSRSELTCSQNPASEANKYGNIDHIDHMYTDNNIYRYDSILRYIYINYDTILYCTSSTNLTPFTKHYRPSVKLSLNNYPEPRFAWYKTTMFVLFQLLQSQPVTSNASSLRAACRSALDTGEPTTARQAATLSAPLRIFYRSAPVGAMYIDSSGSPTSARQAVRAPDVDLQCTDAVLFTTSVSRTPVGPAPCHLCSVFFSVVCFDHLSSPTPARQAARELNVDLQCADKSQVLVPVEQLTEGEKTDLLLRAETARLREQLQQANNLKSTLSASASFEAAASQI